MINFLFFLIFNHNKMINQVRGNKNKNNLKYKQFLDMN